MATSDIIEKLSAVIESRKSERAEQSYVASLHERGINHILAKVGEEAAETVIAAKDAAAGQGANDEVVKETADLWFHSLVMLSHLGIDSGEVMAELERRFGVSGHAEKASRQGK